VATHPARVTDGHLGDIGLELCTRDRRCVRCGRAWAAEKLGVSRGRLTGIVIPMTADGVERYSGGPRGRAPSTDPGIIRRSARTWRVNPYDKMRLVQTMALSEMPATIDELWTRSRRTAVRWSPRRRDAVCAYTWLLANGAGGGRPEAAHQRTGPPLPLIGAEAKSARRSDDLTPIGHNVAHFELVKARHAAFLAQHPSSHTPPSVVRSAGHRLLLTNVPDTPLPTKVVKQRTRFRASYGGVRRK
jgi:hypothetical protein